MHTDARGYVRAVAEGNDEMAYLIARGPEPRCAYRAKRKTTRVSKANTTWPWTPLEPRRVLAAARSTSSTAAAEPKCPR